MCVLKCGDIGGIEVAAVSAKPGLAIASLFAAVLSLALVTSNNAAVGAETVHVGKSSDISFTFVPVDVGIHEKFFQKEGIEVEVASFGGSAKLQQALVAGAVDAGLAAGTDIPFLVKGAPEIGVGAIALTPALFGIILPYDSPVHKLSDLKGKKKSASPQLAP
jgi:ABC-type nitrate/sulfonate/bicarbonate transport system substrate-binding protein